MKSLISCLEKMEYKPPFNYPGDLSVCPRSIKTFIQAVESPKPDISAWQNYYPITKFNKSQFQGLTYAKGTTWFLSKNHKIYRHNVNINNNQFHLGAAQKTLTLQKVKDELIKDYGHQDIFKDYNHFGDMDFYDDNLFVPVENKKKWDPAIILVLSINLEVKGCAFLQGTDSRNLGWCAINPWDNLLYTSDNNNVNHLYAWDISQIKKGGRHYISPKFRFNIYNSSGDQLSYEGMQGGVFTQKGKLYLTRSIKRKIDRIPKTMVVGWDNKITCINMLTGKEIDTWGKDFEGVADEIEGITYGPDNLIHYSVLCNANDEVSIFHCGPPSLI